MTGRNDQDRDNDRMAAAGSESQRGREPRDPVPWLSTEKATCPDRVAGYVHRPELLERLRPTRRRTTVLIAPGGFGKTVLLAESCRALKEQGVVTAWLTLDAQDAPQSLDAYLPFAFQVAGLEVLDAFDTQRLRADSPEHRTALLARAIARHGAPCVLALDELEQLDDRESLALLDYLLKWGPDNLHLAIACREIPATLDVASPTFAGRAELLGVEELRFSTPDIARFFGPGLSRRELASLTEESSGWAIALRILRNERRGGIRADARGIRHAADMWVESRLWRGLSGPDRELLLVVGLFERIDAALLNEVLEAKGAKQRVEAIPAVAGLLETVGTAESDALRLHPLIREHCARRLFREAPQRFLGIHRRIAKALARRGETVAAMRHAAEAGDEDLIGETLEAAGGVRLWLREGLVRLQAADQFVTEEVMERFPRCGLAHCIVLLTTGKLNEARRTYRALSAKRRFAAGDDIDYRLDDANVRGMLCLYGCERPGSERIQAVLADQARFVEMEGVDPLTRGAFVRGTCIACNMRAEFDAALDNADRAEDCLPGNPYGQIFVDLQRGQVAMARGRAAEATSYYARALATARASFLRDPGAAAIGEALLSELNLERNRVAGIRSTYEIPRAFVESGTPLAPYAASAGVVLDLTLQRKGIDGALSAVAEMGDYARTVDLPAVVRYLAAERVSLLVIKGSIGEAEQAWRLDGLPESTQGCLDLTGQSWRELEALACARLRLLIARREFDVGSAFLCELVSVASGRDLWRTWMRALALGVTLERRAGRPAEANTHLNHYLRLFAEADYARPLVRESESGKPALEALLGNDRDRPEADLAVRLLGMLNERERPVPMLTPREWEVLQRLESLTDNEIAAALELTKAGVRYHVGNIFAKLEVSGRPNAVRRARRIGLLP